MDIEISITHEIIKNSNEQERKFCEKYISILKSEFRKVNIHFALICAQEFARKIVSWNLISLGSFPLPLTLHKNEYLAGGAVLANIWNNKFLKYHKKRLNTKKKKLRNFGSVSLKIFITNALISPEKKRDTIKNWASIKSSEMKKKELKLEELNKIKLEKAEVHDYDIFFTAMPTFKYSKKNVLETVSSISILSQNSELSNYFEITDTCKLQFIKRIYNTPNNIIGGFDLDPCRFIQVPPFLSDSFLLESKKGDEKGGEKESEVLTTVGGLYSILTLKQVININCQSKNFYHRIKKYNIFKPLHVYSYSNYMTPICSQKENDYSGETVEEGSFSMSSCSSKKINIEKKIDDLIVNLNYLLSGQFEFFYYRDGVVYELDEFINAYNRLENPHIFFSKSLTGKIPPKKFIKLGLEKIKVFYHRYANLSKKFIIKNSHSQFTGSFNPTSYAPSEIYLHPRKINFLNEFPQILAIYFGLKGKIHKQFIYRILRDYFDDIVLKFLKESYPCL